MVALDLTRPLHVAAALTGATAMTALVVHFVAPAAARDLLGLTFPGLPRRLGESAAVFANNVGVLVSLLAACGAVQLAHRAAATGWERALFSVVTTICDGALALGCAVHVLVIGAAFGAYSARPLATALAHGPFELAAFSLALALYVAGRHRRLAARPVLVTAAGGTAALAVGSLLEVYA